MWLVGVVVRRYIDILILLIPTPLVSVLFFAAAALFFVHLKKMFFVLVYRYYTYDIRSGTYSTTALTMLNNKKIIYVQSRLDHYSAPWHCLLQLIFFAYNGNRRNDIQ